MKIAHFLTVFVSSLYTVYGQEAECLMPDGGVGRCKQIFECPDVQGKVQAMSGASQQMKESIYADLHPRLCSFDSQPKFCCSECTTPDGKGGIGKHLYNCYHMATLLIRMGDAGLAFVNASRISNTMDVCCGPALVKYERPSSICDSQSALPPEPRSGCCGVDAHGFPNINGSYNGTTTDAGIHSSPWTVLLEYEKDGKLNVYCAGALISNRYVLTAAQCITGSAWQPKSVRVGEYDTDNIGRDCIDWGGPTPMCNDEAMSVPVESVVTHPEYNHALRNYHNDIALIRLSTPVRYTDFVRPICLPSPNFAESARLQVTGWGKRLKIRNRVKKTSQLLRINTLSCQTKYEGRAQIWEKQICAGDTFGTDTCTVEGGGALVAVVDSDAPRYELAGVSSFGPRNCGVTPRVPGVYTSVYRYVDWIRQSMRP